MAFRKNDRVMFMNRGEEIHGMVYKGGTTCQIVDDTATKAYKVPQRALQASSRPATDELKSYFGLGEAAFRKGDRVMFEADGRTVHGTVDKGGTSLRVVEDGGEGVWPSIPPRAVRPSDAEIKKDPPHEMDRWGLSGYKAFERMSEETTAFDGSITLDGKVVIHARNDGRGGCNMYYPAKGETRAIIEQFEQTAKDWQVAMGYPAHKVMEAGDSWVSWKAHKAPYNVTAQEDVQKTLEQFREWGMDLEAGDTPKP